MTVREIRALYDALREAEDYHVAHPESYNGMCAHDIAADDFWDVIEKLCGRNATSELVDAQRLTRPS